VFDVYTPPFKPAKFQVTMVDLGQFRFTDDYVWWLEFLDGVEKKLASIQIIGDLGPVTSLYIDVPAKVPCGGEKIRSVLVEIKPDPAEEEFSFKLRWWMQR
jgi:hypothetical protein